MPLVCSYRKALVALFAAVMLVHCSDPVGPVGEDGVVVHVTTAGLRVTNYRNRPLHMTAVGASKLALYDFTLCSRVAECPGLPTRSSKLLASEHIYGWGESHVVVLWWHATPRPEGRLHPEEMHELRVRVK